MSTIRCFLLEPTALERRWLRRFTYDVQGKTYCPANPGQYSYHSAVTPLEDGPAGFSDEDSNISGRRFHTAGMPKPSHDDPRWPTQCSCGYVFTPEDQWQLFTVLLYRHTETDTLYRLSEAPPGAMWDAWWMHPLHAAGSTCDPALHLMVMLPDGREWYVDGPSISGGGWTRSGEAPLITARPSIASGDPQTYHGFLTNGMLTSI